MLRTVRNTIRNANLGYFKTLNPFLKDTSILYFLWTDYVFQIPGKRWHIG